MDSDIVFSHDIIKIKMEFIENMIIALFINNSCGCIHSVLHILFDLIMFHLAPCKEFIKFIVKIDIF